MTMRRLCASGNPPGLVVTLPPAKATRHSDWVDVGAMARSAAIPVHEDSDVNSEATLDAVRSAEPDHVFVVGWSQICREEFLAVPRQGCIGYHPAPLPENRGRAVIPWTILQGRTSTAGTLFWMDKGMDSGDILDQEGFAVDDNETASTLYAKHMAALDEMLQRSIPELVAGSPRRDRQNHADATFCSRRTPSDGVIDWTDDAATIDRLIRASGRPYPGAFTWRKDERVVIWKARLVGPAPYWGTPGQVQALNDEGALIQCGDRQHVLLQEVQVGDSEIPSARSVLRVHEKLGHR